MQKRQPPLREGYSRPGSVEEQAFQLRVVWHQQSCVDTQFPPCIVQKQLVVSKQLRLLVGGQLRQSIFQEHVTALNNGLEMLLLRRLAVFSDHLWQGSIQRSRHILNDAQEGLHTQALGHMKMMDEERLAAGKHLLQDNR